MKVSWDDYSILFPIYGKISHPCSCSRTTNQMVYSFISHYPLSIHYISTILIHCSKPTSSPFCESTPTSFFPNLLRSLDCRCLDSMPWRTETEVTEVVHWGCGLPSGNDRHSCGKIHQCSSLFKGKSTISMVIHEHPRFLWSFSIAILNYQRIGSFLCASIIW